MSVTDSENKSIISHLSQCLGIQFPSTPEKLLQLKTWIDLYGESEESLSARSRQRKSVRKRAQYFARRVYDISPNLFVLCALSYSIHKLPNIHPSCYTHLQEWWAETEPAKPLEEVTHAYCSDLPSLTEISKPHEKPLTKRQRTEPHEEPPTKRQKIVHHTSGDTVTYLAFSQTPRYMVDNLPEPFRTGIETAKQWAEEKMRGGLSITNCITLHLPNKVNEDAFLVIRMGYSAGFHISDTLGLGDLDSLETSDLHNNEFFTQ